MRSWTCASIRWCGKPRIWTRLVHPFDWCTITGIDRSLSCANKIAVRLSRDRRYSQHQRLIHERAEPTPAAPNHTVRRQRPRRRARSTARPSRTPQDCWASRAGPPTTWPAPARWRPSACRRTGCWSRCTAFSGWSVRRASDDTLEPISTCSSGRCRCHWTGSPTRQTLPPATRPILVGCARSEHRVSPARRPARITRNLT